MHLAIFQGPFPCQTVQFPQLRQRFCSSKSISSLQPIYHPHLVFAPPLSSVLESPGLLSIMSQALKKRGRELEALPVSADVQEAKRFHGEETNRLCNVLVLDKNLSQEEEVYAPNEEVVNGVLKSLAEEIGTPHFTSNPSSHSGYNSTSSDISSGQEGETLASDVHGTKSTVDISLGASNSGAEMVYIMDSSDDELVIPLSPFLDFKDEIWQSPQETSEGLRENPDLKSLSEIWHFEDNFEIYQQFELYEDACEASELQYYMNRDFVSQDMSFDGEFSAGWNLETADFL